MLDVLPTVPSTGSLVERDLWLQPTIEPGVQLFSARSDDIAAQLGGWESHVTTTLMPLASNPPWLSSLPALETIDTWRATWHTALTERRFGNAKAEMWQYLSLHRGWDGYDADPIAHGAVVAAIDIANGIAAQFELRDIVPDEVTPAPLADGGVAIEVVVRDRTLIMTVPSNLSSISIYRDDGIAPTEVEVDMRKTDLEAVVDWIAGATIR